MHSQQLLLFYCQMCGGDIAMKILSSSLACNCVISVRPTCHKKGKAEILNHKKIEFKTYLWTRCFCNKCNIVSILSSSQKHCLRCGIQLFSICIFLNLSIHKFYFECIKFEISCQCYSSS